MVRWSCAQAGQRIAGYLSRDPLAERLHSTLNMTGVTANGLYGAWSGFTVLSC